MQLYQIFSNCVLICAVDDEGISRWKIWVGHCSYKFIIVYMIFVIKVTPLRRIIFIQCIVYYHIIIMQILVWLLFLYLDLYRNICKGTVVLSLLGLEIFLLKRIRVDQNGKVNQQITWQTREQTRKLNSRLHIWLLLCYGTRIGNKIVVISLRVVRWYLSQWSIREAI